MWRSNRFGGYNKSDAARVLVLPITDYEIALLLLENDLLFRMYTAPPSQQDVDPTCCEGGRCIHPKQQGLEPGSLG